MLSRGPELPARYAAASMHDAAHRQADAEILNHSHALALDEPGQQNCDRRIQR